MEVAASSYIRTGPDDSLRLDFLPRNAATVCWFEAASVFMKSLISVFHIKRIKLLFDESWVF